MQEANRQVRGKLLAIVIVLLLINIFYEMSLLIKNKKMLEIGRKFSEGSLQFPRLKICFPFIFQYTALSHDEIIVLAGKNLTEMTARSTRSTKLGHLDIDQIIISCTWRGENCGKLLVAELAAPPDYMETCYLLNSESHNYVDDGSYDSRLNLVINSHYYNDIRDYGDAPYKGVRIVPYYESPECASPLTNSMFLSTGRHVLIGLRPKRIDSTLNSEDFADRYRRHNNSGCVEKCEAVSRCRQKQRFELMVYTEPKSAIQLKANYDELKNFAKADSCGQACVSYRFAHTKSAANLKFTKGLTSVFHNAKMENLLKLAEKHNKLAMAYSSYFSEGRSQFESVLDGFHEQTQSLSAVLGEWPAIHCSYSVRKQNTLSEQLQYEWVTYRQSYNTLKTCYNDLISIYEEIAGFESQSANRDETTESSNVRRHLNLIKVEQRASKFLLALRDFTGLLDGFGAARLLNVSSHLSWRSHVERIRRANSAAVAAFTVPINYPHHIPSSARAVYVNRVKFVEKHNIDVVLNQSILAYPFYPYETLGELIFVLVFNRSGISKFHSVPAVVFVESALIDYIYSHYYPWNYYLKLGSPVGKNTEMYLLEKSLHENDDFYTTMKYDTNFQYTRMLTEARLIVTAFQIYDDISDLKHVRNDIFEAKTYYQRAVEKIIGAGLAVYLGMKPAMEQIIRANDDFLQFYHKNLLKPSERATFTAYRLLETKTWLQLHSTKPRSVNKRDYIRDQVLKLDLETEKVLKGHFEDHLNEMLSRTGDILKGSVSIRQQMYYAEVQTTLALTETTLTMLNNLHHTLSISVANERTVYDTVLDKLLKMSVSSFDIAQSQKCFNNSYFRLRAVSKRVLSIYSNWLTDIPVLIAKSKRYVAEQQVSPQFLKRNFIVASIFYETLDVDTETIRNSYTLSRFYSVVGGLLGIYLGESLPSAITKLIGLVICSIKSHMASKVPSPVAKARSADLLDIL